MGYVAKKLTDSGVRPIVRMGAAECCGTELLYYSDPGERVAVAKCRVCGKRHALDPTRGERF